MTSTQPAPGALGAPGALEDVLFFGPEYKALPYRWYREWTQRPPFWARAEGKPVVVAARFRDVETVYRDHATYSSVKPLEPGLEKFDFFNGMTDLVHTDPPDHSRLRAVIQPALLPARIAKLEAALRAIATDLIEPVARAGEPFEFMARVARPLSSRTMLGLVLELPEPDWHVFVDLSAAMVLLGDVPAGGKPPQAYLDAWDAGRRYTQRIIADRRRAPRDDLIGTIVRANADGKVSDDELFVLLIGLFIGGIGTIATQLGNAVHQIASRTDQYGALVEDPSLAAKAFEEVMRFDSAGLFNYKFTTRDCELGGLHVPEGTTVYILQQAAGFDAEVYDDPFRFDIRRNVSRHLSFGYGVHFCIGAPIARLVGRVVLEELARRLPALRIVDDEPLRYGGWLQERALEALPLRPRG